MSLAESASDDSMDLDRSSIPVDELALQLSSPFSVLRGISLDMQHRNYQGDLPGADDKSGRSNIFTVSWPIKLNNGNTLTFRGTLPHLKDQPGWKPIYYLDYAEFLIRQLPTIDETVGGFGSGHDHLGDIGFDVTYGGVNGDGAMRTLGIVNVLPTSEDQSGSRGQWLLGPELTLGQFTRWGLYGIRAKHLTNIAGEGAHEVENANTNETTLNLYFAYALGKGWQIESNPVILYDWEAVSGNEWQVPVGAGLSKTIMIGRVPFKMGFELQKFVVTPDRFGPDWMLKVNFTAASVSQLLR